MIVPVVESPGPVSGRGSLASGLRIAADRPTGRGMTSIRHRSCGSTLVHGVNAGLVHLAVCTSHDPEGTCTLTFMTTQHYRSHANVLGYAPGDVFEVTDPDDAQKEGIDAAVAGRFIEAISAEEAEGATVLAEPGTEAPYDPGAHTAGEVNDYLATADAGERDRVLDAERAGQARKGVLGDVEAPAGT